MDPDRGPRLDQRRLWGDTSDPTTTAAAVTAATTATTQAVEPADDVKVAVAHDLAGRGDGGFNDLADNGAAQAADELGMELTEVTAKAEDTDQDHSDRLRLLADSGHNLYATALLTDAMNAIRPADMQLVIPQTDYRFWATYHTTFWPHHLTRTVMY